MTAESKTLVLYGGLSVLSAVIGALLTQLTAGAVPIPDEWKWLAPVIGAGLNALVVWTSSLLPKPGTEKAIAHWDADHP